MFIVFLIIYQLPEEIQKTAGHMKKNVGQQQKG